MAEIVWSPPFIKRHHEIANYISKDSILYGQEQVKLFYEKAKMLEKHPFLGRPVPELQDPSIKQILCGNYRIIYEVLNRQQVSMITVHHQSRLLRNNPALKKTMKRKKRK